jgi:hypothetical protein
VVALDFAASGDTSGVATMRARAVALLSGATHVVSTVQAGDRGDPILPFMADLLAASPTLVWAGYLSTSAVYGNRDGDWVDERADLAPSSRRGHHRVLAEQQWSAATVAPGGSKGEEKVEAGVASSGTSRWRLLWRRSPTSGALGAPMMLAS